jgi:hypothetical protein
VYAAEDGDFATTGSARIDYRRRLAQPFVELGLGQNGYRRLLAAGSRPSARTATAASCWWPPS